MEWTWTLAQGGLSSWIGGLLSFKLASCLALAGFVFELPFRTKITVHQPQYRAGRTGAIHGFE